jgi:hypothetical protein
MGIPDQIFFRFLWAGKDPGWKFDIMEATDDQLSHLGSAMALIDPESFGGPLIPGCAILRWNINAGVLLMSLTPPEPYPFFSPEAFQRIAGKDWEFIVAGGYWLRTETARMVRQLLEKA